MMRTITALRLFSLIAMAGLNVPPPTSAQDAASAPIDMAIAEFDYADTSGETNDQAAAHAARLERFVQAVRDDLAGSGAYRIVMLDCPDTPCSARSADPATLIEAARQSGARLLLYGGVQKMSTLIQYAKAQVVDLETDQLVFDRNISFRGDDDTAWNHAAQFLVRELLKVDLTK